MLTLILMTSKIVECNCCTEIKECDTCQYNHNTCNDCKKKMDKTECLFCNPWKEKTNEEFNIPGTWRMFFHRCSIITVIAIPFMIILMIIGICVYNFIVWILGFRPIRVDTLTTPILFRGLLIGINLFVVLLFLI